VTKKLADLFKSFTNSTHAEQLEHITRVRSARHIERPVAAVKRIKKEAKQKDKKKTDAKALVNKLSPEERKAMLDRLKGETT